IQSGNAQDNIGVNREMPPKAAFLRYAPQEGLNLHVLDRVEPGFTGPDADGLLDIGHENLAVADPPGLRGAPDRVDGALDELVGNDDLDLHLGQEVDDVFRAPVQLGMALLTPETLGFRDRDA